MNSKKGITMLSLVIYISSFLLITGVVAGITSFFYGNSKLMTSELYSAADFNKLNLYLVRETRQKVRIIENEKNDGLTTLKFSNGNKFTFDETNHTIYYNATCICEGVQNFLVEEKPSYKPVIRVTVNFTNRSFSCKYTLAE